MSSLSEKLEVWGFEEGRLIFKDFSLGAILRLKPVDVSCATDESLNSLHQRQVDFLNGLPAGLSLQFAQRIEKSGSTLTERHSSLLESRTPLAKAMMDARIERIHDLDAEGKTPRQEIFLLLRKPFRKRPKKSRWFAFAKKHKQGNFSDDILGPELQSLSRTVEQVRAGLDGLGIESEETEESEVFASLFDQWNPSHPVPGINFNREDIRDDLVLNDMVMSVKGFALGKIHHRVVSLKIMPEQTFSAMSERLSELPFGSRLHLSIEVLDQEKETLTLETQRRIAYAMYAGKKGVSDLESEAKLKDIEALLSGRVSGEEKIFAVALNIVLRHEDEIELENQVAAVLQVLRELSGAEGMVESLAAGPIFLNLAMPNARATERSRRMNTSVVADFLPVYGSWRGHETPRVLLRNRQGAVLGFDPFSPTLTNFNQIVSGGSGAGKSFLTNILIAQLMKESPKVFIIDIGGSYKKMTENLGGQYVALGAESDISLNPFDLSEDSSEALDQKIKFVTSLVELMTKEDDAHGIGKLERSEIERTIKEIMADEKFPRLTHLRDRLSRNSEAALTRMGKILGPWVGDSPFGKFVDRPSNLKLTSPIVCFDLKGLEALPDLQAVCLFLITDLIWREVQRDRVSQKFVVFDECWRLLESGAGSRFIAEVFRTFRKYRASAIAISQTMDDFSKSKVASAILPNSSVKWILKQTGGNLPALKETLLLNERECRLVESVTSKKGFFSEAFLISGDDRQVVVVESTPIEYWLATTDPADLVLFEEAKKSSPDQSDAEILAGLARRFPRGAISLGKGSA